MILDEHNPITYQEYVSQYEIGDNKVISDLTGDALNQTIYDWYKYRYLSFVDTDKFRDILRRTISVSLPRYEQLLRIEPGVSQYDWLVGLYRERQLKRNSDHELKTVRDSDESTTNENDSFHGSSENWSTDNKDIHETSKKGTIEKTKDGAMNETHSGGYSDLKEGGHSITGYEGKNTSTYSPHVKKITANGGDRQAWSGDQSLAANLPMSESYTKDEFIEPTESGTSATGSGEYYRHAYQHMPALKWNAPSSQSQAGHREYVKDGSTVTESYDYSTKEGEAKFTGDVTTTEGDKDNPSKQDVSFDGTFYDGMGNKHSGEISTRKYDQDKITHDFKDYKETTQQTSEDNKQNTTKDEAHNYGSTDNGTTRRSDTIKNYGNINVSGNGNIIDREQVTGRNEDPAKILERASRFIRSSNAFEWLRHEIEPCFLALYDLD